MRFRSLLLAAVAISIMGLAAGISGQTMIDGVKVDLPYPVRVGDNVVLEPGEYEIRRASQNQDQVLRIYSNDKMRYETHVITVPALDKETPENTKVVLHHIGDDYYFDKIWIEGKDYGYEFVLPERARALKRELAETVPATYVPQPQTAQDTSADQAATRSAPTQPAATAQTSTTQPASATRPVESTTPATQSDSQNTVAPPQGALSAESDGERQAQAERDRQVELAAQSVGPNAETGALAQARPEGQNGIEREANTDSRTAPVSNPSQVAQAERTTGPLGQTNAAQQGQPDRDVSPGDTQQLPATSSNWLGWILGGAALIMLSALVRSKVSE